MAAAGIRLKDRCSGFVCTVAVECEISDWKAGQAASLLPQADFNQVTDFQIAVG